MVSIGLRMTPAGRPTYFSTKDWKLCRRLAQCIAYTRLGFSILTTSFFSSPGASRGSLGKGASSHRAARTSASLRVGAEDPSPALVASLVMTACVLSDADGALGTA